MTPETTHNLYSKKVLYIPDFILPQHVPKVYKYFEDFNIAQVKNVNVFEHPEPEYNCEDTAYYCYAIIVVDEWYINPGSRSFYESILENRCKMVYDDPFYWDLEFYQGEDLNKWIETNETNKTNEKIAIKIQEMSVPPNPLEKEKDDLCSEDSFESLEEDDDFNDLTYEFTDSKNEDDMSFEYYIKYDKKRSAKSKKNNSKKRKYNQEVETLKRENNELKELLIERKHKDNKNYLKNNKRKPENNVWSRRLRAKMTNQ